MSIGMVFQSIVDSAIFVMMRLNALVVFLLLCLAAQSQLEIDSLRLRIHQSSADTVRIKLMLDLAYLYEFENKDSAIAIYERAFYLADQLQNDLYRGKALQYKSIVLHDSGKYAEAIVGNRKALFYFNRATYKRGMASTWNNIGNSYLYLADYQNSLKYYLLAKPYYGDQNDWYSLVTILGNMGECYRQLDDRSKMMEASRESYRCAMLTQDSLEIANAGISLGSALNLNGQLDSSNFYLEQSLLIAESIQQDQVLFYALFDLADAKFKMGSGPDALKYAERTMTVAKRTGNDYLITGAHLLLGRTLSVIPGKQQLAEAILKSGLSLALKIEASDQRLLIVSALADLYESNHQFNVSLKYRKDWIALHDSIFNVEQSRQIAELHTLYELEDKEQQIEIEKLVVLEKEKEIGKRNLQILIAVSLFCVATLLAFGVWRYQRQKRKISDQESTILKQQNESLMIEKTAIQLKSIIVGQEKERERIARELHDGLGGYLTSIHLKAQELQRDSTNLHLLKDVTQMVAVAGKEMRKISHAMAPEGLLKLGLVPTIQHYVQKLTTPTCEICCEVFGDPWQAEEYSELTVYRIIQELLNNILKHAQASRGFVSISFLPDEIHLVVEDNGRGFDVGVLSLEGHGLQNLQARVAYLNATLDVVSKSGIGSSFNITIPKPHV